MWLTSKRITDDPRSEQALRAEAARRCGMLLRDVYGWLFDKAYSPETWRAVPAWALRIPSEISYALEELAEPPALSKLESIERAVLRSCDMLGQLGNPPESRTAREAVLSYVEMRRKDAES